jgi:hypothetical protein
MKPITTVNRMNKTESRYAMMLELRKQAGEIIDYKYEPFKLVLAFNTLYIPDFLVVFKDHFEIHEVKGFWRDDARVKIKVAARAFPWFRFIAVQYKQKHWQYEEFKP